MITNGIIQTVRIYDKLQATGHLHEVSRSLCLLWPSSEDEGYDSRSSGAEEQRRWQQHREPDAVMP